MFVYGVPVEATVGPRTDLPIAIPYLPRTVFMAEQQVVNIHAPTALFSLVHSSNYSHYCASLYPLSDPSTSWSTLAQESLAALYDKLGHKARADYFICSTSNVLGWILKAFEESRLHDFRMETSPPDLAQTGQTYQPSTYVTPTDRYPVEMTIETPNLCPPTKPPPPLPK